MEIMWNAIDEKRFNNVVYEMQSKVHIGSIYNCELITSSQDSSSFVKYSFFKILQAVFKFRKSMDRVT